MNGAQPVRNARQTHETGRRRCVIGSPRHLSCQCTYRIDVVRLDGFRRNVRYFLSANDTGRLSLRSDDGWLRCLSPVLGSGLPRWRRKSRARRLQPPSLELELNLPRMERVGVAQLSLPFTVLLGGSDALRQVPVRQLQVPVGTRNAIGSEPRNTSI